MTGLWDAGLLPYVLAAMALCAALVAGVFLTFSELVMPSLSVAQPAAGSEAMQIVNRRVFRTLFLTLTLGLGPVSALALWLGWGNPAIMAGAVAYLLGVIGVTVAGNVPMNERLAAMPDGSAAAQAYWPAYAQGWTRWNHLRVLGGIVAATAWMAAVLAA
ncbi:DUF1772 domain-containing protein [Jannaschia sp. M317]|uniref:anthrone oxygenase family protein n=1 Tax=Jannaschia sp. M317 TaxID=2867011 RepID=UPI0021A888E8|nr:anthrone oxygenase family protein [Jannaschia sp. M317]UWQ19166.1 DUF1772 domain-containing protein [Jannaschia sp. M317]